MTRFASRQVVGLTGEPSSGKNAPTRRSQRIVNLHELRVSGAPCRTDGPPVDVVAWRRCRLLEAGFPASLADTLSAQPGIDVHELLALVDRGCPPELAARILAPLPRHGTGP